MSTLVAQTLSNGTVSTSTANCIQGPAKAWVNFNGNGGTIRSFFNVSSITVNGTGDYRINYTNAFANANYSFFGCCSGNGGTNTGSATPLEQNDLLTTSTRIVTRAIGSTSTAVVDTSFVSAAAFSS